MENKLGNKIEILGLSELANIALRNNSIETVQDLMLLINKKLLPEPVIYPKPHNTPTTPAEPYVTLKEAHSTQYYAWNSSPIHLCRIQYFEENARAYHLFKIWNTDTI